jgi:hypothetical protein
VAGVQFERLGQQLDFVFWRVDDARRQRPALRGRGGSQYAVDHRQGGLFLAAVQRILYVGEGRLTHV